MDIIRKELIMTDQSIVNKKGLTDDNKICEIVSAAIADIIRSSTNTSFRTNCFETLQVVKDGSSSSLKCSNTLEMDKDLSAEKKLKPDLFFTEPIEKVTAINDEDQTTLLEEFDGFDVWN